jgi:ATP synthase protein I
LKGRDDWARYAGLGLQLASGILLGLFAGYWADKKFGTAPWIMLGGIVLGTTAGFVAFFREVFSSDKK